MRKLYFTFIVFIMFTYSHLLAQYSHDSISIEHKDSSVNIQIFKVQSGWGYDIYIMGTKYIHQETIPAINSNKPFKVKKDAEKIAELVKFKIKKSILPPSITINELDSLGINK